MHPCLQIAEILELIVCNFQSQYYHQCLVFASTCKAFYTPAMNKLWSTMSYGLVPLVKCMSDQLLMTTTEILQDNHVVTRKAILVSLS